MQGENKLSFSQVFLMRYESNLCGALLNKGSGQITGREQNNL